MSDSDSSDNEINAQLLSAVDTSFLNDKLYTDQTTSKNADSPAHSQAVKSSPVPEVVKKTVLKSNRFLDEEDFTFHSELKVPVAMQKHTAEKLSKLISAVIEFDDTESKPNSTNGSTEVSGVRLLTGFDEIVDINLEEELPPCVPLKKIPIVRRQVEDEVKITTADKIVACVCDPLAFPKEVQEWKGPRKRSVEFKYKQKPNGTIVEKVDPFANEFTKARNANQWHESKIRKFKKK
uniref:Uncharacterized protein n=1 Tax=Anopheles epiroticus TaxID=199890 RepID=A0A182PAA9_9DIPT